MPNPPQLDLVHRAISAGVLGIGNIEFADSAFRCLRDDPRMSGFTDKGIRALLCSFVRAGGRLDVRNEVRAEWKSEDPDNPYWYRAVVPVPEFPKGLLLK